MPIEVMKAELRGLINRKSRLCGFQRLQECAEACGVPYAALRDILHNCQTPTLEEFARLCRWLHVSADDLLCLQG